MIDFDKLWNFNNPAATEVEFRKILDSNDPEQDKNYRLELQTQIARTYGLRHQFAEAHLLLDSVEKELPEGDNVPKVRYHLERGRTFNSSGSIEQAKKHFDEARAIASRLNEDFYTVDAIHMQAIAASPLEAIRLNEEALILVETSSIKRLKGWLGALYNNLGWGYFDYGDYEKALSVFLRSLDWRLQMKSPDEIFIAKWCVARALRALKREDEALKIQLAIFEEMAAAGKEDGFVHEELGELYLLQNDLQKSSFHFQKAWSLLSKDLNLQKFEKARLERIKSLAAGQSQ